jgi:hypothetical protein
MTYISEDNVIRKLNAINRAIKDAVADNAPSDHINALREEFLKAAQSYRNVEDVTVGNAPEPPQSPDLFKLNPWLQIAGATANTAGDVLNRVGENALIKRQAVADSINDTSNKLSDSIKGPNNPFIFMNAIAKGVESKGKVNSNRWKMGADALKNLGQFLSGYDSSNTFANVLASKEPGTSAYAAGQMYRNLNRNK